MLLADGAMRPVTVKSRIKSMKEARDLPHMRYMVCKKGFLHMSGDGFTTEKAYAWFGKPSNFELLKEQKPWLEDHDWEAVTA